MRFPVIVIEFPVNVEVVILTNSTFCAVQLVGNVVLLVLPNSKLVKLSEKAPSVKVVALLPQVPKVVALRLLVNVIAPFTNNFLNVNPDKFKVSAWTETVPVVSSIVPAV